MQHALFPDVSWGLEQGARFTAWLSVDSGTMITVSASRSPRRRAVRNSKDPSDLPRQQLNFSPFVFCLFLSCLHPFATFCHNILHSPEILVEGTAELWHISPYSLISRSMMAKWCQEAEFRLQSQAESDSSCIADYSDLKKNGSHSNYRICNAKLHWEPMCQWV